MFTAINCTHSNCHSFIFATIYFHAFSLLQLLIMENSSSKTNNASTQIESNMCIVIGCLIGYSNNYSFMNILEEEIPFDTNTTNLLVQEVVLRDLRKQKKFWKLHDRTLATRAFFKVKIINILIWGNIKLCNSLFVTMK
jgi:hypothetical protein